MSGIRVLRLAGDVGFSREDAARLERAHPDVHVTTLSSVTAASRRLESGCADCVVGGHDPPDVDGLAALGDLRERHADVPFLLYVARADDECVEAAFEAGATDVVAKGTAHALLAARIRNAVDAARTERSLTRRVLVTDVVHRLVREPTRERIEETVCESLTAANPYLFAWVGESDRSGGVVPRASAGTGRGYLESIGSERVSADAGGVLGRALRSEEIQVEQRIPDDGTDDGWQDEARERGYRSVAVVPLLYEDRRYGVLAVYADRTNAFGGDERAMLADLGETTAYAIDAARTRDELSATETNYRELFDKVNDAFFLHDVETGEILDVNRAACEMLDAPREDVLQYAVGDFSANVGPYTQENALRRIRDAVREGSRQFEWLAEDSAGRPFWMAVDLKRATIGGEDRVLAVVRDVTDQHEREANLRAERDRISTLFQNVTDAVLYAEYENGEPIIREVNSAFEEIFGYDAEEILDGSLDDVIVDPEYEAECERINETVRNGERVEREVRRRTTSGVRDFLLRAIPLELADGRMASFGMYIDITEHKRREQTLEVLHEATRRLMEAETEKKIAEITVETAREILDLPLVAALRYDDGVDELAPIALTEFTTELYDDPYETLAFEPGEGLTGRAFDANETRLYDDIRTEEHVRGTDQRVKSALMVPLGVHGLLFAGSPDEGAFDEFDVYFAELLGDNAEAALNRAERERLLRERETELVRERDRSTALFENIPDPAINCTFVDGEPIVDAVNPAFEEVFGYDAGTVVGESVDEYLTPAEHETEASDLNRVLQEGESVHAEVRRETARGVRDFLLHVVPFKLGERSVKGYAIYTDITDRKRHEAELTRQNERLEEFTSIVSHDLRNPLSIARGYAELARETGENEHLERVERAHDRMDRLIGELLELARQGKMVGETESTGLEPVVESAWANVETDDATLDVEDPGSVEADADRLCEAFENLFRNAMEHGGTDTTVRVGPLADGFYVEDDGPGIPESEREEVFESGFTTARDGTGFGLAIVERIVDEHGWRIVAAEGESGGARFEVRTGGESVDV